MRRFLFLVTMLLAAAPAFAQTEPDGLVAFRLHVPEDPIVQGDRILVRYVLDATHYSVKKYDGGMDGAVLESVEAKKAKDPGEGIHRLVIDAIFRVRAHGRLLVHPMSAMIGDDRVWSDSVYIQVQPHPEYGEEWSQARAFLLSRGAPGDGIPLEFKYSTDALVAFSNPENQSFAIVARKDYQPYMANPVLAYGIGNALWNSADKDPDNSVYHILSRYDDQLELLRSRGETYQALRPTSYEPSPEGVKPLLENINFGQGSPYNVLFPKEKFEGKDSTCLAGCGPVALAQVLAYHRNGTLPHGKAILSTESGKQYSVQLDDFPFDWTGRDSDLSALMLDCAASVGAKCAPNATASNLESFKTALLRHWDYSPLCTLVDKYYEYNMLAMLYRELDNGNPVIVADDSHIFVVDGYEQDYLHLNLGWKGYCNGYYRAIVIPTVPEKQLPFNQMLTGIRPMGPDDRWEAKIHVREPGTLSSLLTPEEQRRVTSLTVTGTIDGEDIELLRSMAGAVYRLGDYERGHGSLMELDLGRATIVGGKPYAYKTAGGMTISGTVYRNGKKLDYKFDMDHITDADWDTIVKWDIDRSWDWKLGRTASGTLYVKFITKDNVIGSQMFERCANLRVLTLPKNIESVENQAFFLCRALEKVNNLPDKTDPGAFSDKKTK